MNNTRRQFVLGATAAGVARAFGTDIFEAAATGNLARAKELCALAPGIVNLRSDDGRTPLHFAAAAGQVEMVSFLMLSGADLSAGPESPLLDIADYPDHAVSEDMARPLLGNASNPNAGRKDGTTVLHLAAARGNAVVTRLLIHRGAAVNATNIKGETSRDVATGRAVAVLGDEGRIERVYFGGRYVQDIHGGNVSRDDTNGLPQLFINEFVRLAHFEVEKVKQMYKSAPALLATRATWDEIALEAAAHMGLVSLAEFLADAGSPVSTCTAVLLGLSEMTRKMIDGDRNRLRERGAHDFPLLGYTAYGKERAEIAAFLLKSGLDVNVSGFGGTTLHIAASKGYLDLAAVLLDHGADVNAAIESHKGTGPTPLAVALKQKQAKMADYLASRGGRS
jgi:ankyrin repeat protein